MNTPPLDLKIGSMHKSNSSGYFEVVEYKSMRNVKIKFLATGCEVTSISGNIRSGSVKDFLIPSIYGVGFFGRQAERGNRNPLHDKAYTAWSNMMRRCYDTELHKSLPTYIGVTVCEDWHNFSTFEKWFIDNFIDGFHMDKDIKIKGNKIYSPSACMFVSPVENIVEARSKHYEFLSPQGVLTSVYNIREFSRDNSLNHSNMCAVHLGKRNHHKGWTKL